LQYVVARWGFRTLDLYVDRRVLIPRPETEVVAGAVIDLDPQDVVIDLGTGSGAIALAVAVETSVARVIATDQSEDALAVARANLAGIGSPALRVQICAGDWFDAVPADVRGAVDVVVSNPPYIAAGEQLPSDVIEWEPQDALIAGPTGMEAIERIVAEAPAWLRPGGALVLEIAPHQADDVRALATGFADVEIRKDLAGRDRVLVAR
jgi:release factor glutamine methyltransferase